MTGSDHKFFMWKEEFYLAVQDKTIYTDLLSGYIFFSQNIRKMSDGTGSFISFIYFFQGICSYNAAASRELVCGLQHNGRSLVSERKPGLPQEK